MNRLIVLAAAFLMTAVHLSCREEMEPPPAKPADQSGKATSTAISSVVSDSSRLDSMFDRIRALEATLGAYPGNERMAADLLAAARDSVSNCFFVIGRGTMDTSLPESARQVSQKISAKYSAERWAIFCKARASGRKIPYTPAVEGKVLYGQEIKARQLNDTLYLMLKVPIGSITVK
jgi:hypothetical protein